MLNRLSGWQRVGVILSVLWIVGVGGWHRRAIERDAGFAADFYRHRCEDEQRRSPIGAPSACWDLWQAEYSQRATSEWLVTYGIAFLPLPFFWLAAWIVVATVRWVRRGFAALAR